MNSPLQYPNTKLYFVRHGRTEWNRTGRLMGQTDIPLDAVGRSQAHSAARWMRALPIERVYASPLARARETGRILAEHLEVPFSEDERWREVDMGVLAGLTWSEVEESHPDFVQARQVDPASAARLDGESDQVMQRRAVDAFIDVIRECAGRTVAVASHGGHHQGGAGLHTGHAPGGQMAAADCQRVGDPVALQPARLADRIVELHRSSA